MSMRPFFMPKAAFKFSAPRGESGAWNEALTRRTVPLTSGCATVPAAVTSKRIWPELSHRLACPSAYAAPRLRLRLGRPGRGYEAHSRLSRTPEHSAHRQVHRDQPGPLREAMEVRRGSMRPI